MAVLLWGLVSQGACEWLQMDGQMDRQMDR